MTRRIAISFMLAAASAAAHAHEGMELDSALHHALHDLGTERLVILGGSFLALVVAYIVRRVMRAAAERRSVG